MAKRGNIVVSRNRKDFETSNSLYIVSFPVIYAYDLNIYTQQNEAIVYYGEFN